MKPIILLLLLKELGPIHRLAQFSSLLEFLLDKVPDLSS